MEKTIHVLYVPARGKVKEIDIENSLDALQLLVAGYIQPVYKGNSVIHIVNEDGLLIGLDQNEHMPEYVGNVVICSEDDSGENFASITSEDVKRCKEDIKIGERLYKTVTSCFNGG